MVSIMNSDSQQVLQLKKDIEKAKVQLYSINQVVSSTNLLLPYRLTMTCRMTLLSMHACRDI